MRRSRVLPGLVIGAAVLVVVGIVVAVVVGRGGKNSGTPTSYGSNVSAVAIPVAGGAKLNAYLIKPAGSGVHPLVVMPGSWGSGADEYVVIGKKLAARGYIVISYAQRGFGGSTGSADVGGSQFRSDVSTVIDWAIKHTGCSRKQIAAVGTSYGAGASLLAAEHDSRIRAVVATSTWTDLLASYFSNRTPSVQVLRLLLEVQAAKSKLNPLAEQLRSSVDSNDVAAFQKAITAIAAAGSPISGVDALNKNGTAVMIANGFDDSLFPPEQLEAFFDELTGPKRLQLAAGDHGGPEIGGLLGQPNEVWTAAIAWLDHYLRGVDNGIDKKAPLQLKDETTGQWHGYAGWADAGSATVSYLGDPADAAGGGLTVPTPETWSDSIEAGVNTAADTSPFQINRSGSYRPTSGVAISQLSREHAFVFNGSILPGATLVSGSPKLNVTVNTDAPSTSLFAYLYDVDASGSGTLMSYEPYTLLGASAGSAEDISITMQPVSWTVPASHHLSLVVDTVDARYMALSRPGSSVTFSSSAAAPATFSVPVG